VRLPRRCEGVFDADVELAASCQLEPDAAARAQRLRLLDLLEAEQLAEEATRLRLASGRSRELDVI
jgi:hypothetical protein